MKPNPRSAFHIFKVPVGIAFYFPFAFKLVCQANSLLPNRPATVRKHRNGLTPSQRIATMARATQQPTTKLSGMFRDPLLRAAFQAAVDDGLAPAFVETDHPRTLNGGAAERMTEPTGHRITALVEA
jgi:hypothetical protein